jgi:hypothetical protein
MSDSDSTNLELSTASTQTATRLCGWLAHKGIDDLFDVGICVSTRLKTGQALSNEIHLGIGGLALPHAFRLYDDDIKSAIGIRKGSRWLRDHRSRISTVKSLRKTSDIRIFFQSPHSIQSNHLTQFQAHDCIRTV